MIRVSYVAPSARIANYVQGIFLLEQGRESSMALPLFANGTPTLVFHHTDSYEARDSLTLYGQTILPDHRMLERKSTTIAYYLRPWCLRTLFGLAANELTDRPVDFELISKDNRLGEKLRNAGSTKQMLLILEDCIAGCAAFGSTEDLRIRHAVNKIFASPQKEILIEVQRELHITERSFQRLFGENIGVSPNQFRRIVQFSKAFCQLNKGRFSSLSDVAFDNGYADQSHFNRAFREFTNLTASQYLDSRPSI